MTFTPGQSGNPGGRPKGLAALVRAETRDGAELVEFMLAVLRGRRRAPLKLRLEAAHWLADRGFGKPVQTQEVTGADGGPLAARVEIVYAPAIAAVPAGPGAEDGDGDGGDGDGGGDGGDAAGR